MNCSNIGPRPAPIQLRHSNCSRFDGDDDWRRHHSMLTYSLIPIPLSVLAFVTSLALLAAITKGLRSKQLHFQYYAFIFNRTLYDLILSLAAFLCAVVALKPPCNGLVNLLASQTLDTLATTSLWFNILSYFIVSIVKLIAIIKPLHYKSIVTRRRCLVAIGVINLLTIISLTWSLINFNSALKFDNGYYFECTTEKCLNLLRDFNRYPGVFFAVFLLIGLATMAATSATIGCYRRPNNAARSEGVFFATIDSYRVRLFLLLIYYSFDDDEDVEGVTKIRLSLLEDCAANGQHSFV